MIRTKILAATFAASTIFTPLYAQQASIEVHFDDVNLGNQRGVSTLDRRIHNAAEVVCGAHDALALDQRQQAHICIVRAVRDATPARDLAVAGMQTRVAVR